MTTPFPPSSTVPSRGRAEAAAPTAVAQPKNNTHSLWPVVIAVCLIGAALGAASLAYFVFAAPYSPGASLSAMRQKGQGASALLAFAGIGGAMLAYWASARRIEEERATTLAQMQKLRRDSERAAQEQARLRELHENQTRRETQQAEEHRAQTRQFSMKQQTSDAQRVLLETAVQSANDVIMISDATNRNGGGKPRVLRVNDAFKAMTGYDSSDIVGNSPAFLQGPQTDEKTKTYLRDRLNQGLSAQAEILNYKKNGTPFWVELNIQPVYDGSGHQTHWISVQRDITERKKADSQILWQANHDALTGLPNRKLCQENLDTAIEESLAAKRMVGIVFLDVDRFKNVNDTLGHQDGDDLLQQVSRRLLSTVPYANTPGGPTVARVGGDEFVLVFPKIKSEIDVSRVAQKLLDALCPSFSINGNELYITASMGISFSPNDGRDTLTLLKNADTALYRAKDEGRDTFRVYEADMNAQSLSRLHMETHLRRALTNKELFVMYQPQVEAESGRMYGVEALVRWNNPQLGIVSPGQFIPLAEETGLIGTIGKWVLEEACRTGAEWVRNGHNIKMSVNVSARQVEQDLVTQVKKALADTGLPPHLLDLEITESVLVRAANVADVLHALKDLGVRVSVDDFGTGYTNFAYLKTFPLDAVKIDRSFVMGVGTDKRSESMARALITLAHEVGWSVVAEGVENETQRTALCAMGCPSIQGFLFSPAVAAEKVTGLAEAWANGITNGKVSKSTSKKQLAVQSA